MSLQRGRGYHRYRIGNKVPDHIAPKRGRPTVRTPTGLNVVV